MTTDKYNIDKLFKEKLGEASQAPPSYMWHRISDSLNVVSGSKRKGIIWLSAASFALLIAFGAGYFMAINRVENSRIVTRQTKQIPDIYSEKTVIADNHINQSKPDKSEIAEKAVQVKQPVLSEKKIVKAKKEIIPTIKIENPENQQADPTNEIAISNFEKPENSTLIIEKPNNPNVIKNEVFDTIAIAENLIPEIIPEKDRDTKSKWIIGGSASPLYAFRNIKNGESNVYELANNIQRNTTLESDKGYYDLIESPLIAFTGGLDLQYEIGKRLSVQSGLHYSRQGQVTNEILIYEELNTLSETDYKVINSSAGDVASFGTQKSDYTLDSFGGLVLSQTNFSSIKYSESNLVIHLDYIEFPILINYKFIDKKIDALLTTGLVSGILASNKALVKSGNDKELIGSTQDIRSFNLSGQIGLGIEYNISPKLIMTINPLFRYSLRTLNESYYIENYPFSFSVLTGLKARL